MKPSSGNIKKLMEAKCTTSNLGCGGCDCGSACMQEKNKRPGISHLLRNHRSKKLQGEYLIGGI